MSSSFPPRDSRKVRVLRVLEYVFDTQGAMDDHLAFLHTPLQGEVRHPGMTIRSTSIFPTGEDGSLFTLEAPRELVDTVHIFTPVLADGIAFGSEKGLSSYKVVTKLADVEGEGDYPSGDRGVMLFPGPRGAEWGEIRARAYARKLTFIAPHEVEHLNVR